MNYKTHTFRHIGSYLSVLDSEGIDSELHIAIIIYVGWNNICRLHFNIYFAVDFSLLQHYHQQERLDQ